MTTRVSNHIRSVKKLFGLVIGDAKKTTFAVVEELVVDRPDGEVIVGSMLVT